MKVRLKLLCEKSLAMTSPESNQVVVPCCLCADNERQAVETVRTQYVHVRKVHDASIEDAFFDLKSVLGEHAC